MRSNRLVRNDLQKNLGTLDKMIYMYHKQEYFTHVINKIMNWSNDKYYMQILFIIPQS